MFLDSLNLGTLFLSFLLIFFVMRRNLAFQKKILIIFVKDGVGKQGYYIYPVNTHSIFNVPFHLHWRQEGSDQLNWEDIDEDAESSADKGIPLTDCLFCAAKLRSLEEKCEHMAAKHSFYIPDMAHVSDLEGLMRFLGVKVGDNKN